MYLLAPVAAVVPALLAFAVIPFGPGVTLFDHYVPFQISDLSVGILWVLAMASVAVYGVMLAGWSSGSNYPLLGAVRSNRQLTVLLYSTSFSYWCLLPAGPVGRRTRSPWRTSPLVIRPPGSGTPSAWCIAEELRDHRRRPVQPPRRHAWSPALSSSPFVQCYVLVEHVLLG